MRLSPLSVLVAFFAIPGFLSAQVDYKVIDSADVGSRPSAVVLSPNGDYIYAICAGVDANLNGIKDEGDMNPSVWKIGLGNGKFTDRQQIIELRFNSLQYPVRYDQYNHNKAKLLMPSMKNELVEVNCDMGTQTLLYSTEGEITDANYLDAEAGYVCSISPGPNNNGQVCLIDINTKKITASAQVGINPTQVLMHSENGYGALCLGPDGKDSSEIWIGDIVSNGKNLPAFKIPLDGLGNHILFSGGRIYATNFTGHALHRINVTYGYADTLPTLTEPGKGPRQSLPMYDNILVTTYGGDLLAFNCCGGTDILGRAYVNGKLEGLCAAWDKVSGFNQINVFVASPYTLDGAPNTKVYFLQRNVTSAFEPIETAPFSIYPTPAREALNIEFDYAQPGAKIEILDAAGRLGAALETSGAYSQIDLKNFAQGSYFAVITIGNRKWGAPFTIVR